MTARIDKRAVLEALRAQVAARLESVASSQRDSQEGATHEEARPENDKDTRALESSYLARGLARRVGELQVAVSQLAAARLRDFGSDDAIGLTALVTLEREDGTTARYFLAPAGSGFRVSVGGADIGVVTPQAPLGHALLGKRVDDEVEVRAPRGVRVLTIVAVS